MSITILRLKYIGFFLISWLYTKRWPGNCNRVGIFNKSNTFTMTIILIFFSACGLNIQNKNIFFILQYNGKINITYRFCITITSYLITWCMCRNACVNMYYTLSIPIYNIYRSLCSTINNINCMDINFNFLLSPCYKHSKQKYFLDITVQLENKYYQFILYYSYLLFNYFTHVQKSMCE